MVVNQLKAHPFQSFGFRYVHLHPYSAAHALSGGDFSYAPHNLSSTFAYAPHALLQGAFVWTDFTLTAYSFSAFQPSPSLAVRVAQSISHDVNI